MTRHSLPLLTAATPPLLHAETKGMKKEKERVHANITQSPRNHQK